MDGFNNSAVNGFISVVYVKRSSSASSGNFYHGCSGSSTNNLSGSANTNPYFNAFGISSLPENVWCVAIGVIYAANDSNTNTSSLGGVYRLDTGVKITGATTYRQKPSNTLQQQRVYHYYSTSPTAKLDFAKPAFYVTDGSEPTLSELTAGAAGGDDVYWSANGNDIHNDNSGNVGIGTTNPAYKLTVNGDVDINNGALLVQQAYGINLGVSGYNIFMPTATRIAIQTAAAERLSILNNGNVGIGTVSPAYQLDIKNSSNATARLHAGANSSASLRLQNDAQHFDVNLQTNDKFAIYDHTAGTQPLTILPTSGNVGIGTANPTARLHLEGDSIIEGVIRGDNVNLGLGGAIKVKASNTASDQYVAFGTTPSGSSGNATFTEKMRINSSGNVGIGTTTPSVKLEVKSGGADDGFYLQRSNNTNPIVGLIQTGTGDGALLLRNASNVQTVILRGQGNSSIIGGNVGIGILAPTFKLHVKSDDANDDIAYIHHDNPSQSSGTVLKVRSDAGNSSGYSLLDVSNNSVNAFYVRGDGKVGIGITSPQAKLHITGTVNTDDTKLYLTENTNLLGGYFKYNGDANINFIGGLDTTERPVISYPRDGSTLSLLTGSSTALHITSSRNVGIGTTNPDHELQVKGDISIDNESSSVPSLLHFNASNKSNFDPTSRICFWEGDAHNNDYTTSNAFIEYNGSTAGGGDGYLAIGGVTNAGSNTDIMVLNRLGNVGIGTTSPSSKLHLGTSCDLLFERGGELRSKDTGGGVRTITRVNSANELEYGWSGAGPVKFMGGGSYSERMRIHTGGNVGIGTTNPSQKLDVAGTVKATSYFLGSSSEISLATTGAGSVFLRPNGQSTSGQMKLASTGSVTINAGTNSSTTGVIDLDGVNGSAVELVMRAGNATTNRRAAIRYYSNQISTTTAQWVNGLSMGQTAGDNNFYFNNAANSTVLKLSQDGKIQIGNNIPMWSGSYGGALFLKGNNSTSDRYAQLTEVNSTGAATSTGLVVRAGNVGIGTVSPNEQLHILSTASDLRLQSTGADAASRYILQTDHQEWRIGSHGGLNDGLWFYDATGAGGYRMLITPDGNVGIGNTSPAEKLHVGGDIRVGNGGGSDYNRVEFTRYGGSVVGGVGWHSDAVFYIGGHPSLGPTGGNIVRVYGFGGDLRLGDSANGDVLTIDNTNGNVGIGTTNPSTKLHVAGYQYVTLGQMGQGVAIANKIAAYGAEFRSTNASAQIFFGRDGGSVGSGAIGADATYLLKLFKTNNFSTPFVITQSGNVGINKNSPAQKLDVVSEAGHIRLARCRLFSTVGITLTKE